MTELHALKISTANSKLSFYLRVFGDAESTFAQNSERKSAFSFAFRSLIRNFAASNDHICFYEETLLVIGGGSRRIFCLGTDGRPSAFPFRTENASGR